MVREDWGVGSKDAEDSRQVRLTYGRDVVKMVGLKALLLVEAQGIHIPSLWQVSVDV